MTIRRRRRSGLRAQTRTLNGSAVDVNRLRADHLPTSALCKTHWWQERLRSALTTKCVLAAALLILPALGAPVHADDPIAQWLKQDESDGQNEPGLRTILQLVGRWRGRPMSDVSMPATGRLKRESPDRLGSGLPRGHSPSVHSSYQRGSCAASLNPKKSEASGDDEADPAEPHRYRPVPDVNWPAHINSHQVEQRYQGEDYPGHDRKRFLVHERSSQFFITPLLGPTCLGAQT